MFNKLQNKFSKIFETFTGKKTIEEEDINKAMQEIKSALIDADTSLAAIEKIVIAIREEILGTKVLKNVTAYDMIVKACNDAFIKILSSDNDDNTENNDSWLNKNPLIIMMIGLQGSGKTTTCAKIAKKLKKEGKKVLLASLDIYRFAAQQQLKILADENQIDNLEIVENENPMQILKRLRQEMKEYDAVIIDTAGRLQIDETMMTEIIEIKAAIHPNETLLVLDAMMGQDAENVAHSFHQQMHITGLIVNKMDSDTRGGSIISVKAKINRPIRFIGIGEKIDDLEDFHANRIAGRILDMGDIITMVEKAQENLKEEEVESMVKRFQEGNFDLHDFYKQMKMVGKMGGLSKIMAFMPGMGSLKQSISDNTNDSSIKKNMILMDSMTKEEKYYPDLLDQPKRQKRIALGSGMKIHELQKLLQQFNKLKKAISKMKKMQNGMPNINDLKNMNLGDLKNLDFNKLKDLLGK